MSEGSGLRRQGSQRPTELPNGEVRASSTPSPAKAAQARVTAHAPWPSHLSPAAPPYLARAPCRAACHLPLCPLPCVSTVRKPSVSNGASALTREERAAGAQRALR